VQLSCILQIGDHFRLSETEDKTLKNIVLSVFTLLLVSVPGAALAFGHGGSPVTTMPIIGDLIHLFGWYPQAFWAVLVNDHYAMAVIAERCLGHSFIVELCYGSFERGIVTVILLPLFTALTIWLVYRLINTSRRQSTLLPA